MTTLVNWLYWRFNRKAQQRKQDRKVLSVIIGGCSSLDRKVHLCRSAYELKGRDWFQIPVRYRSTKLTGRSKAIGRIWR